MRVARAWGLVPAVLLVGAADDRPADYAVRLPVTPAPGAAVQRVEPPAGALAALRTRGLTDLRLFDADGRAVPIARVGPVTALRRDRLKALPILGPADGARVTGVAVTLDPDGAARISATNGGAGAGAAVLGVLFDARAVKGEAAALALDADLPPSQPVTLTVEASRDLKDWRTLAEQVAYRAADGGAAPTLRLNGSAIRGDWLRLTWRGSAWLLAPVTVRGAVLASRAAEAGTRSVRAIPPAPADGRAVEFALPFATPLVAVEVVPADGAPVPVRVLGRDDAERPWAVMGEGVARRAGAEAVALSGGPFRFMRIEADRRSPGFTAAPALRFRFAAVGGIAFAAADARRLTLAVGREGAADPFLPLASLTGEPADRLPVATVAAAEPVVRLAAIDDAPAARRRAILWAVLLGAALLLGGIAWALWRQGGDTERPVE